MDALIERLNSGHYYIDGLMERTRDGTLWTMSFVLVGDGGCNNVYYYTDDGHSVIYYHLFILNRISRNIHYINQETHSTHTNQFFIGQSEWVECIMLNPGINSI